MKIEIPPFVKLFVAFKSIDKIDIFYKKRFQFWLYEHSHEKDETLDAAHIIFSMENINTAALNCSGTTEDGLPLTEEDFIQTELSRVEKVESSKLKFGEYKRVEYYREFLHEKMKSKTDQKKETSIGKYFYPHTEVFKSKEAYLLFDRLYHNNKDSTTKLADFSFIYRRMKGDGFLQNHQKPEVFREWLSNEPYNLILDNKFKTLPNCTTRFKEEAYQAAKELVQEQQIN